MGYTYLILLNAAKLLSKFMITFYIPTSQIWAVHSPIVNHDVVRLHYLSDGIGKESPLILWRVCKELP
jgi:hypothetical protein